ncbi:MAG: alpha/beta hydrolase [Bacteroidetes bacterium]|jgi:dienelactone hydrolase|nr:alpha/beta hydrolase [Bacteroidota bacterium]
MTVKIIQSANFIIGYNDKKPIVADITYQDNDHAQPIVIFCHGYKGYKDWGAWHLAAQSFAKAGFVFLKFNFSHNGGTFENPIDFPDLDAFGQDNFSKQMQDLKQVINFAKNQKAPLPQVNTAKISLLGHSRGGGIACLMTYENQDIDKLVTWSSVSNYKNRFPKGKDLEAWQNKGVYYVKNGRTKQDMPHYYQFYEDFLENQDRFDIQYAAEHLKQPFLIIHGEDDETVKLEEAKKLNYWCKHAKLKIISNATHTYNTKQPWDKPELSIELKAAVEESIAFLKRPK